jgi:prepilin-type processing-associated H-X9-DG protein
MGLAMILYSDDSDGFVPRGNQPFWWVVYIPYLGGTAAARDQYGRIKVYTCPSYPDKRQVMCYVVNAWQFTNPRDRNGTEVIGLTRINRVQKPSETIYFADNENGSWRPVFTITNRIIGSDDLNDVWAPNHLPYPSASPTARPSGDRRVAATRHGQGPNLMYFDGHAGWMNARRITVDDWREQRW